MTAMTVAGKPSRSSSGTHLWLVLMKAHQALADRAQHSIANTGLCFSDFAVLEILLHKGPTAVNDLGRRVGLTSGSATTAVDRLAGKRLVRREPDPADRRSRIVHLTPIGRKLIKDAFQKHAADMELATGVLSDREKNALADLLKKLGKSSPL